MTTDEKLNLILSKMDTMESKIDSMDNKIGAMDIRMDRLESQTLSVMSKQLELHQEIQAVKATVEDTYILALDAWGQSEENRGLINAMQ